MELSFSTRVNKTFREHLTLYLSHSVIAQKAEHWRGYALRTWFLFCTSQQGQCQEFLCIPVITAIAIRGHTLYPIQCLLNAPQHMSWSSQRSDFVHRFSLVYDTSLPDHDLFKYPNPLSQQVGASSPPSTKRPTRPHIKKLEQHSGQET